MAKDCWKKAKCVDFADNTTLHGLKQIAGSNGKIYRRVIWLCLLLSMLGLLLFYFIKGLMTYMSFPTVIRINTYENASLLFPAITVCNNNMLRLPYLVNNAIVSKVLGLHTSDTQLAPHLNLSDPAIVQEMRNIVYSDIFLKGNHRIKDAFIYCGWDRFEEDCLSVMDVVVTDTHGACYTFNSKGKLRSGGTGNPYGLELMLDLQQYFYGHMGILPAAGMKLVVHEAGSLPMLQEDALLLNPGMSHEIRLFRRENILLPSPYEGQGCYKGNEYKSLSECKMLCFNKYILSKCHCQYMPMSDVFKGARSCSLYDYHICIAPETDLYRTSKSAEEDCGCLYHCSEVGYETKASSMRFPSKYAADYFNQFSNFKFDTAEYRENVISVLIYYGNLVTTVTEQVPSYTFANFSAEAGGYMGLCVGASLLTLTELLEFLLDCIRSSITHRKKNPAKAR